MGTEQPNESQDLVREDSTALDRETLLGSALSGAVALSYTFGVNMRQGWLKLYRKWAHSWLAKDPSTNLVFMHLLCDAAFFEKDNPFINEKLAPGETDLTQNQLAELTGLSRAMVQRSLRKLDRRGTITRRGVGKRCTVITIVNWDGYQQERSKDEQELNKTRTKSEQKVSTPKESKKGRRGEGKKKSADLSLKELYDMIPESLERHAIEIENWLEWKYDKNDRYTAIGAKALFSKMEKLGADLPQAIENSLANGWKGLFRPDGRNNGKAKSGGRTFEAAGDGSKFNGHPCA